MKPYPSYKPSGIEWLGDIPEHWDVVLFKRVISNIKDGTHGSFNRVSNGQPLLSAKNVFHHGLQIDEVESNISNEDFLEITKNGFPRKYDLLLTCVGTLGRSFVYDLDYPLAFQRSVTFIRLRENHSPKFYKYITESAFYQFQMTSLAKTSAQSGVYMSDILQTLIPKVSMKEQQLISGFLDQRTHLIDTLFAKKQKLIELLKEYRTAIINQAVTKGLDPNVKMKDSGIEWLGEVPEGWKIKKLKYLSTVNDEALPETTSPEYLMNYIEIGDVNEENGIESHTELLFKNAPSRARRIVKEGDVILSTVRTYLKAIAFISKPEFNQIVSTGFAVIRANKDILEPLYAYYVLRSDLFLNMVVANSIGVSYPAINSSSLIDLQIMLPDIGEQQVILNYLINKTQIIDNQIEKEQKFIEYLKEYRTSLISEVVTGKVKVTLDD